MKLYTLCMNSELYTTKSNELLDARIYVTTVDSSESIPIGLFGTTSNQGKPAQTNQHLSAQKWLYPDLGCYDALCSVAILP